MTQTKPHPFSSPSNRPELWNPQRHATLQRRLVRDDAWHREIERRRNVDLRTPAPQHARNEFVRNEGVRPAVAAVMSHRFRQHLGLPPLRHRKR